MIEPELRLIKALQTKGVFLLDCEVTPSFVIAQMAFFDIKIKEQSVLQLVNIEDRKDKLKLVFPVNNMTVIYELQLERIL
jgi:hypothetical protein